MKRPGAWASYLRERLGGEQRPREVTKSDDAWREQLSPEQYRILRRRGTGAAFTGHHPSADAGGSYRCAGCGGAAFPADAKFDSGTGWPSFSRSAPDGVEMHRDFSLGIPPHRGAVPSLRRPPRPRLQRRARARAKEVLHQCRRLGARGGVRKPGDRAHRATSQGLANKVALITGSDSGLGQATAVAFAAEGADLVITYLHDADGAADTAKRVTAAERTAELAQLDISDEIQVASAFDRAIEAFGTIDILTNNRRASMPPGPRWPSWPPRSSTQPSGPTCTGRLLLPPLHPRAQEGRGAAPRSSTSPRSTRTSQRRGRRLRVLQGAVRNLTRTLALELAPLRINVNNLAPGMVLTPFNQPAIDDPKVLDEEAEHPVQAGGTARQIARLALSLASDDSDYCTGIDLHHGRGPDPQPGPGSVERHFVRRRHGKWRVTQT